MKTINKHTNAVACISKLFGNSVYLSIFLFIFAIINVFKSSSLGGVPFSDSQMWEMMASNLSEGRGLGIPYRPFYPIFLSFIYIWTGPNFVIAQVINLIVYALIAPLIYIIGKKVFNAVIGCSAALFFILDPVAIETSNYTITETLGLFLMLVSMWYIVSGLTNKKSIDLFLAGVFFMLSNLTRTLSLIAYPAYILSIYYILAKQNIHYKKILKLIGIFTLGIIISITPWIVRQKMVFGITSISSNIYDALYGVTNPKYGNWTPQALVDANENDIAPLVKERIAFYKQVIRENLHKYPMFYLKNMLMSFAQYMTYSFLNSKWDNLLLVLFISILIFNDLIIKQKRKITAIGMGAIGVFLIHSVIHSDQKYVLILIGMMLSFLLIQNKFSLILSCSLLFTGIGAALFNFGKESRLHFMADWLFYYFYLFSLHFIYEFVNEFQFNIGKFDFNSLKYHFNFVPSDTCKTYLSILKLIIALGFFFVILSSGKLLYLNYLKNDALKPYSFDLTISDKHKIMKVIQKIMPGIFDNSEFNSDEYFVKHIDYKKDFYVFNVEQYGIRTDPENKGKIIIYLGKLTRYIYYLPPNQFLSDYNRLFFERNYDRSIFYMTPFFGLFPGKIPESYLEKDAVIVGRLDVDTTVIHSSDGRFVAEAIAIIPYSRASKLLDFTNALIAGDERHLVYLTNLKNLLHPVKP